MQSSDDIIKGDVAETGMIVVTLDAPSACIRVPQDHNIWS